MFWDLPIQGSGYSELILTLVLAALRIFVCFLSSSVTLTSGWKVLRPSFLIALAERLLINCE